MSQSAIPPSDDVMPDLLLTAYCRGIFPMAEPETGEVYWYRPERRGVIPLDQFHLSRKDRKLVRRGAFEITSDRDFEGVMRACAEPRPHGQQTTWISESLIRAYTRLHEMGYAHCVEAHLEGRLVGGIYGVSIASAFFGESMFIRPQEGGTNASKICLAWLVAHLRGRGYSFLDTQFQSEHLRRFGCVEITRREYEKQLVQALEANAVTWGEFPAACPLA